jgi:thiol-disulfide isomerase/thioredoxin
MQTIALLRIHWDKQKMMYFIVGRDTCSPSSRRYATMSNNTRREKTHLYVPLIAKDYARQRKTLLKIRRLIIATLVMAMSAGWTVAAEFHVDDTNGKTHTLEKYLGKWVLVNFWATWCPPCLEEIPEFSELYQSRKNKDLMVFGIAVDFANPKLVLEFAERQKMSYPLILGDDDVTAQFGKINVLPTTFLYDPKGKKVLHRIGPLTRAELEKLIGK